MILGFLILIYSIILHEVAHGFVADRLGDPTARLSGRLTLDPRPHIDPFNTILLPLMLFLLQSPVIFGAAKPVPVDPFNFRDPKKDLALVALSGPLTNILIAVVLSIVLRLVPLFVLNTDILTFLSQGLFYGIEANLILAFFNLFPLPPLDGFKVVGGILPDDLARQWMSLERYGFFLLFFFLIFFQGIIFRFINPFVNFFNRLLLG